MSILDSWRDDKEDHREHEVPPTLRETTDDIARSVRTLLRDLNDLVDLIGEADAIGAESTPANRALDELLALSQWLETRCIPEFRSVALVRSMAAVGEFTAAEAKYQARIA